tara:strand:- start:307 stop:585 length:279 start_codon:yes stop_codon:yes gene_type:complete
MSKSPLKKYFEKSALKYHARGHSSDNDNLNERDLAERAWKDDQEQNQMYTEDKLAELKKDPRYWQKPKNVIETDDGTDYDPDVYDPSLHEDD